MTAPQSMDQTSEGVLQPNSKAGLTSLSSRLSELKASAEPKLKSNCRKDLLEFKEAQFSLSLLTFKNVVGVPIDAFTLPKSVNKGETSWTGDIQHMQVVSSLLNSASDNGTVLDEAQVEYIYLLQKLAEECMLYEDAKQALLYYIKIVRFLPSYSLAYFKIGLLLCFLKSEVNKNKSKPDQSYLNEASSFFNVSINLEPFNKNLSANIDMVLSICTGVLSSGSYFSNWQTPKSQGDIVIFTKLISNSS